MSVAIKDTLVVVGKYLLVPSNQFTSIVRVVVPEIEEIWVFLGNWFAESVIYWPTVSAPTPTTTTSEAGTVIVAVFTGVTVSMIVPVYAV